MFSIVKGRKAEEFDTALKATFPASAGPWNTRPLFVPKPKAACAGSSAAEVWPSIASFDGFGVNDQFSKRFDR